MLTVSLLKYFCKSLMHFPEIIQNLINSIKMSNMMLLRKVKEEKSGTSTVLLKEKLHSYWVRRENETYFRRTQRPNLNGQNELKEETTLQTTKDSLSITKSYI